jgi:radical SAM-linked protein
MNPTDFRFRVTFSKAEAMRYTGHLDLHRAWERLLRRARLPLAYSHGFNPHPQIQLGPALPLGITGDAELVEFWLTEERTVDEVQSALREAAPPGILVREARRLEHADRHLDKIIAAGEYIANPPDGGWPQDFSGRVEAFLARSAIARERRGKPYDLRPLVLALEINADQLSMVLALGAGATGRPEEVLAELGVEDAVMRLNRSRLVLVEAAVMPVLEKE